MKLGLIYGRHCFNFDTDMFFNVKYKRTRRCFPVSKHVSAMIFIAGVRRGKPRFKPGEGHVKLFVGNTIWKYVARPLPAIWSQKYQNMC